MSNVYPEYVSITVVVICVIGAGLASGLTQGLLSLDQLEMAILMRSGTDLEKSRAKKLLPIIESHHLLIVTLMLWNATFNEVLPIFLDDLVPTYVAIILSITLILIMGEILPAALMTGPKQLAIVSNLTWLVYIFMFLILPISWPLSRALDYFMGVDEKFTSYNRRQLAEMVRIQVEERVRRGSDGGEGVDKEDMTMIHGVLKFSDAVVKDIMTSEIFMLSVHDKLSLQTLNRIFKSGYSRIPIYDRNRNDVIGLILAKDLLFIDPDDEVPLRSFLNLFCRPIQAVWPDQKLDEVLQLFRQSRGHMAVVRDVETSGDLDPVYRVVGIVTLEDLLERILGNEIMDETDTIDENQKVVKDRNRDVELMRMSMLNPSLLDLDKRLRLSSEEIRVITAHLLANVPSVVEMVGPSSEAVERLVRHSPVFEVKRVTDGLTYEHETYGNSKLLPENRLYKRGKISNCCILILSGKVKVIVGRDGFNSEVGAWSTLGQSALVMKDDEYVPDFSAYVDSPELRYLRISKPAKAQSIDNVEGPIEKLVSLSHKSHNSVIRPVQPLRNSKSDFHKAVIEKLNQAEDNIIGINSSSMTSQENQKVEMIQCNPTPEHFTNGLNSDAYGITVENSDYNSISDRPSKLHTTDNSSASLNHTTSQSIVTDNDIMTNSTDPTDSFTLL